MTAPARFRRNSADVQAMRLEGIGTLWMGAIWVHDHGVPVSPDLPAGVLWLHAPDGSRMVARLGDWLTYDGEVFAVEADDGGRPSGHTKVEGEG